MLPHVYESIVNGEKIRYDSMKIKHQKMLVELNDNIAQKEEPATRFFDLVSEIVFGGGDPSQALVSISKEEMFYCDFEYIIFMIRAKSYGGVIKYTKKIEGETIPFSFDIGKDFKVVGEKGKSSKKVVLLNGDVVEMSPITVAEMANVLETNRSNDAMKYSVLTYSIRRRANENESFELNTYAEKSSYFNGLEIEDLKRIKNAYNEFPTLQTIYEVEHKGKKYFTDVLNLVSFFFEEI